MPTPTVRYNPISRILHWLIAGLIVSQYVLAKLAERAEEQEEVVRQLALLANHKSIGITILALVIVRIVWRVLNPPPALPASMPAWQHRAASVTHWLLYGLIVALPITGWLMSSAKSYSVSWFNLFVIPDFVAASEPLAARLLSFHDFLAEALFVLAVLHLLAALKHHWLDKDDVLQRMFGWKGFALFLLSASLVVWQLGQFDSGPKAPSEDQSAVTSSVDASSKAAVEQKQSDLPVWDIDYSQSWIKFSGDQAGAPFEGQWRDWQAEIQFDEAGIEGARFNVKIDIASVESGDAERDGYIVSEDFFNEPQYAQSNFVAQDFERTEHGFVANAQLTMKGITNDVDFHFVVEEQGNTQTLKGKARLDRLAWNIGVGDWTDTSWVGQFIEVDVLVTANK